jgi:type IV secretion system protein VirD4
MASQKDMYIRPPRPGFIGGYNWAAIAWLLLSLTGFSWIATAYVAATFAYQPALGAPIIRHGERAVYAPWKWFTWGVQFSGDNDPQVREPMVIALGIVCAGSIFAVGSCFAVTRFKLRTLSQGADEIHGSARWSTFDDVRKSGFLRGDGGVYIGALRRGQRLHYLRHVGPGHVIVFAPTRGGKGVSFVIPSLLSWRESTVVYDIKGENWALTAGFRAQQGQKCLKFSPTEIQTCRFNILNEVRLFTDYDVKDAQNIAHMTIHTGEGDPPDPHWRDNAVTLLAGIILHVAYLASKNGRVVSFADVMSFVTAANHPPTINEKGAPLIWNFRMSLIEMMTSKHCDLPRWTTLGGTKTNTHPLISAIAREMLDKEEEEFSGVLSAMRTGLQIYHDPLVLRATAASDFRLKDLVTAEQPISLYLVVPASDKERLRPLIRLIFTAMVWALCSCLEFENGIQKRNARRLLLLIDEFPSLRRMPIFADALSYMAGFGLKAYLIVQDINQVVDAYGPNQSIISNCHIRIALAPNNLRTAEEISNVCGRATVPRYSPNFSGNRSSLAFKHVNVTVQYESRPLLSPDEVMRLKPIVKEHENTRLERAVAPGDALIFTTGRHPIYGSQMLYFLDPELLRRTLIAPPLVHETPDVANTIVGTAAGLPDTAEDGVS